jgi:Uncharacterized protein conserved in bacteria (DUF2313).
MVDFVEVRKLFPKIYDDFLEVDEIANAQTAMCQVMNSYLVQVFTNQFILTADTFGIERFEKLLGITASSVSESLEFRRQRVLNRFSMNPPYTLNFLKDRLDNIVGVGNWALEVDYDKYEMTLKSAALNQAWFTELQITIGKIKPANIVLINNPFTTANITVNEQIGATRLRGNYRLGGWRLEELPFISPLEIGVIKMDNQHSILDEFLNRVTSHSVGIVEEAVINGSLHIPVSQFELHTAQENAYILKYRIPVSSGLTDITTIDLVGNKGSTVFMHWDTYVPLVDDVLLEHRIKFEEVL